MAAWPPGDRQMVSAQIRPMRVPGLKAGHGFGSALVARRRVVGLEPEPGVPEKGALRVFVEV
jgi:hypothetical protein